MFTCLRVVDTVPSTLTELRISAPITTAVLFDVLITFAAMQTDARKPTSVAKSVFSPNLLILGLNWAQIGAMLCYIKS